MYSSRSHFVRGACIVDGHAGVQEMESHDSDLRGLRGMFLVGALMVLMGTMNFFHTSLTIVSKQKAAKCHSSQTHAAKRQ